MDDNGEPTKKLGTIVSMKELQYKQAALKAWQTRRKNKTDHWKVNKKRKEEQAKNKQEANKQEENKEQKKEKNPYTRNSESMKKAWETRRKNGTDKWTWKTKNKQKETWKRIIQQAKNYKGKNKTKARELVAKSFSPLNSTILCLETHHYHFVTLLDKKNYFIIYEHDKKEYNRMTKSHREYEKHNKDIIEYAMNKKTAEYAFLDFCNTIGTNEERLQTLEPKLRECRKIALTFSMRNHHKTTSTDCKTDITNRTLDIFKNHKIEQTYSYHERGPMILIILTHWRN